MKIQHEIIKNKKGEISIKETGHIKEYTLTELEDVITYNEKLKKETEANAKIRGQELINVIEYYPDVLKLTDEQIFRIAFYGKVKKDVKDYEQKIKEVNAKLKEQYKIRKLAHEGK